MKPSFFWQYRGGIRQTPVVYRVSTSNRLSRRDFLKLTGVGTAALFLPDSASAGWFGFGESAGLRFHPDRLADTHDLLSLSRWGPYSKKYFGITHIPDVHRGLSFDLSLFPLLAHGPAQLPTVMSKCGVHPWEAVPDMGFYSLRQELIWKDRLYCDWAFFRQTDDSRLIRLELVNQTGSPQEIVLHSLAQLVFPPLRELTAEPIRLQKVELPPGAVWVHALDYTDLEFAKPRPTDNLVPDGKWRGEERRHESVGGSVVAQRFGRDAGDRVRYRVGLDRSFANAKMVWRFQAGKGQPVDFEFDGAVKGRITFRGTGTFDTVAVPLGKLKSGECDLRFVSKGGAPVVLNGFVVVEAGQVDRVRFVEAPWHPVPKIGIGPDSRAMILQYQDVPNAYGFATGVPLTGREEVKWRDLDGAFGTKADPNTRQRIFGNRRRHRAGDPDSLFVHAFSKPFTLRANSRRLIYGVVCQGTRSEVQDRLSRFMDSPALRIPVSPAPPLADSPSRRLPDSPASGIERVYHTARKKIFRPVSTPAGKTYEFSQRLMAATTLSNLVYPLRTQGNYIRDYSPGRNWDCLYTWDAGFSGLGLAELDLQCAVEILNAYTTPAGAQSAFIHHGSPVPVQIYLFHELWNRTQSRELLEYFYPRLRQYHLFLAGRLGSSTTRRHRDHLICTWDYFYNSGGWDDYPPQKFVHAHKLEASVAPAVNSSHTIRCAKMLRQAAAALGRSRDFAEYDQDIAELSASLQKYSWDAASGYFGYVTHDKQGVPTGILRDDNGVNFNMGLDGVYPLVAGICSSSEEKQLLERVFSPKHLWMDIGVTTVDQSAPYYSTEGYWNGSVWLAHQWFLWKTMLDLGRADLAHRIARTGLDLWKKVTDATYDCMEHFIPREPFGAGWHQFTSLSSPVLPWFASLYTPGRLTCGFEVWTEQCRFSGHNRKLRAKLKIAGSESGSGRQCSILACMSPGAKYRVEWNSKPAAFTTLHEGLLQIQVPRQAGTGVLQVKPA